MPTQPLIFLAPPGLQITVPCGTDFSQLELEMVDGMAVVDDAPLKTICKASGIALDTARRHLGVLLLHWYRAHLAAGGAADPVAHRLVEFALANEVPSYNPGVTFIPQAGHA